MNKLKKWSFSDWAIAITILTWFVGIIFLAFKYGYK